MTSRVTDPRSNSPEQLVFLAKAVGRSDTRIAVFRFIHKGKKKLKSVSEIVAGTKLSRKKVLDEAKKLVNKEVVKQDKKNGEIAYEIDPFCYTNREKIISYANNPAKLNKVPTKHNPVSIGVRVSIRAPKALV